MKKILNSVLALVILASAMFAGQNVKKVLPKPQSVESQQQIKPNPSEEVLLNLKNQGDLKVRSGVASLHSSAYYDRGYHSLSDISVFGDSIVLEDGSVWEVNRFDGNGIQSWKQSDPILVFPTDSVFSPYKYIIVNQVVGNQIEVNMAYGPVINNPLSLKIVAVDYLKGEIYLSDHSRWAICDSDSRLLNQWIEGDYIVVGTNGNPEFCSLNNILINSNMYNHVFARQF